MDESSLETRFTTFVNAWRNWMPAGGAIEAFRRPHAGPERRRPGVVLSPVAPGVTAYQEEDYFLVATLYPLAEAGDTGNLGNALRMARSEYNERGLERRLETLLDAEESQFPFRLRQAVRLLFSNRVPVSWPQLLRDLLNWNRADRRYKKLGRSFFAEPVQADINDQGEANVDPDPHAAELCPEQPEPRRHRLAEGCHVGGVRRGRISSQCLKRSIRRSVAFEEAFKGDELLARRTKRLPGLIKAELEAMGVTKDDVAAIVGRVPEIGRESTKGSGAKAEDEEAETKQLILAPNEIRPMAEKLLEIYRREGTGWAKAKIENITKELGASVPLSVDVAMFGRMTTSAAFQNIEAAVQVAHALSTNALAQEFDYYTAVDDLSGESGAV
jgi:CRISPR type I-E-associated protein CasB/Cse2